MVQMMRKIKPQTAALSATLAAIALSGCGSNSTNTTSNNGAGTPGDVSKVSKITVGYNPTIVQPQPLLGVVGGDYARALDGVTVSGKEYSAGPAVVEALRAGVIDIGCSGPYPAMQAFAKAGDIVLLCGAATGGTELMVAKNSPIKSVKDLKGKRIGVNQLGSTVDAMVRNVVVQAGLNPQTDVQIREVKPPEQAQALQRGDMDAVAAPSPWPSQVAVKGNGRPLVDWRQILDNGNYLAGSIYTTKKFAQAHPDFIKQFIAANQAITDRLNKDRTKGDAAVLAAWSKVTGKTMPPVVAKAAFASIKFTTDPNPQGLQHLADIAYQVGVLRRKADLSGFVFTP